MNEKLFATTPAALALIGVTIGGALAPTAQGNHTPGDEVEVYTAIYTV